MGGIGGRKAVLLIVKEKEEGESRQTQEGWKDNEK